MILYAEPVKYRHVLTINSENEKLTFGMKDGISEICVDNENKEIYLFHADNMLVRIFNFDGIMLYKIRLSRRRKYSGMHSFAVDGKGNIYLFARRMVKKRGGAKEFRTELLVFDFRGRDLGEMELEPPPGGHHVHPGKLKMTPWGDLCVLDASSTRAVFFDIDGKYRFETSKRGIDVKKPEGIGWFTDVAFGEKGDIYALSRRLAKVFQFDNSGNFIRKFGRKGGARGAMSQPLSIGVDPDNGHVHVLDMMRMTVLVFDREGNWKFEWGGAGTCDGRLYYPKRLVMDSRGHAYISDMPRRLQIFRKVE